MRPFRASLAKRAPVAGLFRRRADPPPPAEPPPTSPGVMDIDTDTETASSCNQGIKVIVRTPKEKKTISTMEDVLVKDFKVAVAEAFGTPVENQLLTFANKILQDRETLRWYGITDGATVHLVVTRPGVSVIIPHTG